MAHPRLGHVLLGKRGIGSCLDPADRVGHGEKGERGHTEGQREWRHAPRLEPEVRVCNRKFYMTEMQPCRAAVMQAAKVATTATRLYNEKPDRRSYIEDDKEASEGHCSQACIVAPDAMIGVIAIHPKCN